MSNISKINVNGTSYDFQDKISGYVTNLVNDLTNYYLKSETYAKGEVDQLINAITTINIQVVENKPETGQSNIIYLVPVTNSEEDNYYEEWLYINNQWELIGTTKVDLTGYATKEYVDNSLANINIDIPVVQIEYNRLNENDTLLKVQNALNEYKLNGFYLSVVHSEGIVYYNALYSSRINPNATSMSFYEVNNIEKYNGMNTWDKKNFVVNFTKDENDFYTVTNITYNVDYSTYKVLDINNTKSYTPTGDYHPATKKYVDENAGLKDYEMPIIELIYNDNSEETRTNLANYINSMTYSQKNIYVSIKGDAGIGYNKEIYHSIIKKHNNYNSTAYFDILFPIKYTKNGSGVTLTMKLSWDENKVCTITEIIYGMQKLTNFSNSLLTTNTEEYTPTSDYNPATKKYVDDTVATALGDVNTVLATLTTVEEVVE